MRSIFCIFILGLVFFVQSEISTNAEKFLLSYEKEFFWTLVTSSTGYSLSPRALFLHYNPEVGFYIVCKYTTRKVTEIQNNPYVTLSFKVIENHKIPVFHASAIVTQDRDIIRKAWYKELQDYGYSSPEDPQLTVIIFTIHYATQGYNTFEGKPYTTSTSSIQKNIPYPPLPTEYKEKEAVVEIEKEFKRTHEWNLLTYDGVYINDRLVELKYGEEIGYHIVTNSETQKVRDLQGNANVALFSANREQNYQVIIDGTLHFVNCLDLKKSVWKEEYTKYGWNNYDDEKFVVLRLVPRRVVVHSFSVPSPLIYNLPPTPYDRAQQIIYSSVKSGVVWSLATVDKKGRPHSRSMGGVYSPPIGFLFGTRSTNKTTHIISNPRISLSQFNKENGNDISIEGISVVIDDDNIRKLSWDDQLINVGYTGPDDKNLLVIPVNPTKITYVQDGKKEVIPIECLGKKEEKPKKLKVEDEL